MNSKLLNLIAIASAVKLNAEEARRPICRPPPVCMVKPICKPVCKPCHYLPEDDFIDEHEIVQIAHDNSCDDLTVPLGKSEESYEINNHCGGSQNIVIIKAKDKSTKIGAPVCLPPPPCHEPICYTGSSYDDRYDHIEPYCHDGYEGDYDSYDRYDRSYDNYDDGYHSDRGYDHHVPIYKSFSGSGYCGRYRDHRPYSLYERKPSYSYYEKPYGRYRDDDRYSTSYDDHQYSSYDTYRKPAYRDSGLLSFLDNGCSSYSKYSYPSSSYSKKYIY